MIRDHKPKPEFKIESVEEWKARTKKEPKQVNFKNAYEFAGRGFGEKFQLTSAEAKAKQLERARQFKESKNAK